MGWKTINGKRKFFPDGNMAQHETRENQTIKKLESDITRLRNPNTAMNPVASAFVIKSIQSEINESKSINNIQDKRLRQKMKMSRGSHNLALK